MNKIVQEILQILAAVIIALIVLYLNFGNEVFTETVSINVEETYYVISLYALLAGIVIPILALISFLRTLLKKFENPSLNWSALLYNSLLLLIFPMIFGLYESISDNSINSFNESYLATQILYAVAIFATLYIAFRIGKRSTVHNRN